MSAAFTLLEAFHATLNFVKRSGHFLPRIRPDLLEPDDLSLYVARRHRLSTSLNYPESQRPGSTAQLPSCLCTAEMLSSEAFRYWIAQLREDWRYHRKVWEFGFICQALFERGLLTPHKRGLGFAVGREPLPALFAAYGCCVVATDLAANDPRAQGWATSGQWARTLDELNQRDICPPEVFRERVSYQPVDMNAIPPDLTDFDFTWSSCSFEHCGSIELGVQFLMNQMNCLKPGGVAIHTTEFNLTSNAKTIIKGRTVIFRRADIERIALAMRALGHRMALLDLSVGSHPLDWFVDERPYSSDRHLRKRQSKYATTSIGLIITKKS